MISAPTVFYRKQFDKLELVFPSLQKKELSDERNIA